MTKFTIDITKKSGKELVDQINKLANIRFLECFKYGDTKDIDNRVYYENENLVETIQKYAKEVNVSDEDMAVLGERINIILTDATNAQGNYHFITDLPSRIRTSFLEA